MIAFSDNPGTKTAVTQEAKFAIDLTNAYLAGHLPGPGGWLDQDSYHVRLIDLTLSIRQKRSKIANQKRSKKFGKRKRRR